MIIKPYVSKCELSKFLITVRRDRTKAEIDALGGASRQAESKTFTIGIPPDMEMSANELATRVRLLLEKYGVECRVAESTKEPPTAKESA